MKDYKLLDQRYQNFIKANNYETSRQLSWLVFVVQSIVAIFYTALNMVFADSSFSELFAASALLFSMGVMPLLYQKITDSESAIVWTLTISISGNMILIGWLSIHNVGLVSWAMIFFYVSLLVMYFHVRAILTIGLVSIVITGYYWFFEGNRTLEMGLGNYIARIGIVVLCAVISIYSIKKTKARLKKNYLQIQKIEKLNQQLKDSRHEIEFQKHQMESTHQYIQQAAYHDSQSGLSNRNKLIQDFRRINESGVNHNKGLFHFRISNYKSISSNYGPEVLNDYILNLIQVVSTICDELDGELYRISTHELIFLLNDFDSARDIKTLSARFIDAIAHYPGIQSSPIITSVHLGVVLYPDHGLTLVSLMRKSQVALNQAKSKSTLGYEICNDWVMARFERKIMLMEGLKQGQKDMFFALQPIFDIQANKLVAFEALIRWDSNELGFVSPAEFIPYAEENLAIIPIGEWAVKESLSIIKTINDKMHANFGITINISKVQLENPGFLRRFLVLVESSGVDPNLIELDIGESVLAEAHDYVIRFLGSVTSIGISIALDDFGTGQTSLSYLHKLPIDKIKIDGTFIRDMKDKHVKQTISTLLTLAHKLGQEVIAEGVEFQEQLEIIRELGYNYAQGFLLSKPIDCQYMHNAIEKINGIRYMKF